MLEAAEIGRTQSRKTYESRLPALRVDLLNAQFDLREASFPVILLVAGDDWIGCNELINVLHEWMDARFLQTNAFGRPSEEERERPRFWRYWRTLPGRGEVGLFVSAWPENAIADRLRKKEGKAGFERRLDHISRFEETLVAEGALLLKFWLHLPKKELQKRLARARKKPNEHWRVGAVDGSIFENWDRFMPLAERLLSRTSTGAAPWHVVESTDERYRNLTVAETILRALRERLATADEREAPQVTVSATPEDVARRSSPSDGVLARADLASRVSGEVYERTLARGQRRLRKLSERARRKGVSSVLVFEGWDAAGKGGTIRRLTGALDAIDYRTIPITAPCPEEQAHHYLWRFWRHLPRAGRMLIFDRSWYGRVLVERVEGFASRDAWQRAYAEIRDFEEQIVEHGIPLAKFWLHIDPETQLERFRARESTPYKKYKITDDDYRNRDRRDDYVVAVEEMIARTGTEAAPWVVVPANDKKSARLQVLDVVCQTLEKAL